MNFYATRNIARIDLKVLDVDIFVACENGGKTMVGLGIASLTLSDLVMNANNFQRFVFIFWGYLLAGKI